MRDGHMFKNREEAARLLVDRLREYKGKSGIILAIPRGGLVCGRIIADALEMPLEAIVAKKIPAPGEPELAIGAVCGNAVSWNHEIINALKVPDDYLRSEFEKVKLLVAEKEKRYRNAPLNLKGKICILTDDGIATGHTMAAAIEWAKKKGPQKFRYLNKLEIINKHTPTTWTKKLI